MKRKVAKTNTNAQITLFLRIPPVPRNVLSKEPPHTEVVVRPGTERLIIVDEEGNTLAWMFTAALRGTAELLRDRNK